MIDYIVVGAGIYGATVAERLASRGLKVLVIDRRDHIAGNIYSYKDKKTGIEIHKYGSHIFHTTDDEVWDYVTRFTQFNNYIHTVPTRHNGVLYPMPINLDTINHIYNTNLNETKAKKFVEKEAIYDSHALGFKADCETNSELREPANLEEKGISLVGKKLYTTLIKNYTEKQWHKPASELPADILKRIPVRFSNNDKYFIDAKHQGIPVHGYTEMIRNMLASDNITVHLNTSFAEIIDQVGQIPVIYCGQIDELLNYELGVLPYRSLRFESEWVDERDETGEDSKLGHAVINEADSEVAYTRTHYYKYYQIHQPDVISQPKSISVREYPADFKRGGDAYYPVENKESIDLYNHYISLLRERHPNIMLGGRLGAFKYWDMDKAVRAALDFVNSL